MIFGGAISALHGFVLPIALLILAQITDTFQFHETSRIIANLEVSLPIGFFIGIANNIATGGTTTVNAGVGFYEIQEDFDIDSNVATLDISIRNKTNGIVNCSQKLDFFIPYPYNHSFSFTIFDVLRATTPHVRCYDNESFIAAMNLLILGLVGVALVAMLLGSLQVLLFTTAAQRQVKKARLLYFNSILRQEREWYDKQLAGALTTKLLE